MSFLRMTTPWVVGSGVVATLVAVISFTRFTFDLSALSVVNIYEMLAFVGLWMLGTFGCSAAAFFEDQSDQNLIFMTFFAALGGLAVAFALPLGMSAMIIVLLGGTGENLFLSKFFIFLLVVFGSVYLVFVLARLIHSCFKRKLVS